MKPKLNPTPKILTPEYDPAPWAKAACVRRRVALFAAVLSLLTVPLMVVADTGVPAAINYQGKLTDSAGKAVTNGLYQVEFRIWGNSTSTNAADYVWGRSYALYVVSNGMFNVLLSNDGGTITNWPGIPTTTDLLKAFESTERYLGLRVTQTPTNTVTGPVEISPRQRLSTAPFAIHTYRSSLSDYAGYSTNSGYAVSAGVATNAYRLANYNTNDFLMVNKSAQTLTGSLVITNGSLTVTNGNLVVRSNLTVTGAIGVGTTAAARAGLEIERGTTNDVPALRLASASLGEGSGLWLENRSTVTNIWAIHPTSSDGFLHITNRTTAKDALTFSTNGCVGVGVTTNSTYKLHVGGTLAVDLGFNGGAKLVCVNNANDNSIYLEGFGTNGTASASAIYITGSMAGTLPKFVVYAAETHLGGKLYASGLTNIGDFHNVQYNSDTGQFSYDDSTRRHKENIRPLEADWLGLLNAQPKTYTRPGWPNRWEIGFIAEDLDALGLKPLVLYDQAGQPDGIHYEKMSLYLVEIAKAQQQALREKEARLEALENDVAELKRALSALSDRVNAATR